MGRRALRKIDPSLDLSRHLTRVRAAAPALGRRRTFSAATCKRVPGRWKSRSARAKGFSCASGRRRQSGVDFLGIEIVHKYARFAAAGLAKAGLTNAPRRIGRRHADLRRVAARRLARGGPRLLSRSLVEEAASQAAGDERDVRHAHRARTRARRVRSTSGPTSKSTSRSRWSCWPPIRGWPGRWRCPKRRPSTIWPTARISSGGCG